MPTTATRAALLALCVVCASAPEAAARPDDYGWDTGRVIVRFPEKAQASSQTTKEGLMKTGLLFRDERLFFVQVVEGAPPAKKRTEKQTAAMFANARGSLAPSAKVLSEKKDQLADEHPGRVYLLQLPMKQGYMVLRVYLVQNDLCAVLVAGPRKDSVEEADAKAFLGSLKLSGK